MEILTREILSTKPEFYADRVLRDLGANNLPVDLDSVLEFFGLHLSRIYPEHPPHSEAVFGEEKGKVQSQLLITPEGDDTIYLWHDLRPGRERFSVAHEIGHYDLPWHPDSYFCSCNDFSRHVPLGEREANRYAAELLMPLRLISELINSNPVGYDFIASFRRTCKVSFEAAAIRIVTLNPRRCALALVRLNDLEDSREYPYLVRYCVKSKTFPRVIPAYTRIRPNDMLDSFFQVGVPHSGAMDSTQFCIRMKFRLKVQLKSHGPGQALVILTVPDEKHRFIGEDSDSVESSTLRPSFLRKAG